ncbi:hypothetical protein JXR93_02580 [bacterium]|nr:hypothetical protein [bacterium]
MKVAIHHRVDSFSSGWIDYCKKNSIDYEIVDPYQSNIVNKLKNFDIFLWHWNHSDSKDLLFARQLILSLENMNITVFPDSKTSWHFDDKVGQKYLLESIDAPLVSSYVFYTKEEALNWCDKTTFPKVFKLRGGAGSHNVKLAKTKYQAIEFINIAFGKGFNNFPSYTSDIKTKIKRIKSFKNIVDKLFRAPKILKSIYTSNKMFGKERGYVYFQDFIPNNRFDIRVIVIGDKAFAIKRVCRENDFRASGSGLIIYDKKEINIECIKTSFLISEKLNFQCMTYDFVFDKNNKPMVVEMSYGFTNEAYFKCDGVWTKDFEWIDEKVDPPKMILEQLIKNFK